MPEFDEKESNVSPEAIDLITKLLKKDKSERLGNKDVQEIMGHEWFSSINWNNLKAKKLTAPYIP